MRRNIDKKTWGVLGKQKTYYAPSQYLQGKEKIPLNNVPTDAWDYKKSKYYRIDLVPIQQGGVVPQATPAVSPAVSPTLTPTPSVTPTQTVTPTLTTTPTPSSTSGFVPQDCLWNTNDEFWSGNTNQWQQCQDVPTSPTPSVTPTNTPTPSITASQTPTNTPSETPTNTPTSSVTATATPTLTPSNTPSVTPTLTPTQTATNTPTPSITPSATGGAFSPNQISNLQFWFMGNSGATASSWTNYGLLGGSTTQAVLANQPTVKTNTVFGTWTGTSMNFLSTDNMSGTFTNTNYSSSTIYVVYRHVTQATAGDILSWRLWNTTTIPFQQISRGGVPNNSQNWAMISRGVTGMTGTTYIGIPILSKIQASGTTSGTAFASLSLNETPITIDYTGSTFPISATTMVFGSTSPNANINTQIAEFILYNKNLSSSEQTQVEDYLKTKYQYSSW